MSIIQFSVFIGMCGLLVCVWQLGKTVDIQSKRIGLLDRRLKTVSDRLFWLYDQAGITEQMPGEPPNA